MTNGSLTFRSTDGLTIEGGLDRSREETGAVVLCHPHPKMGGTMNAPLLLSVRDHLVRRGWSVLRFNFRGIGRSEGEAATGEAEVADALGAIDCIRREVPGSPVAIAGWSFGGAVAVRVAAGDRSLAACVAIAPAVEEKPDVTAGLPDPHNLDITVPLLVVVGANDKVVLPHHCRTWTEDVATARYVEIQGANHFFWGKYDALGETIASWLEDVV
jgi:alpha/beta superfamily hydrolase